MFSICIFHLYFSFLNVFHLYYVHASCEPQLLDDFSFPQSGAVLPDFDV